MQSGRTIEAISQIDRENARLGYQSARKVTRVHAKTFYFASHALSRDRRDAAFALYAFCRRLDDLVDGRGAVSLAERLEDARAIIAAIYEEPTSAALRRALPEGATTWPLEELVALSECIARFGIPRRPWLDLVDGMQMDLTKTQYASFAEVDLYCYRVAGTVGLLMTPVLGGTDLRAASHAADLGRAMQLTNILRDIGEDLRRGRVYLAQDDLAAFHVAEDDLRNARVTPGFRELLNTYIVRARTWYRSGELGVKYLEPGAPRRTVRLMGALYAEILRLVEEREYDVYSRRASVPLWRKCVVAASTLSGFGQAHFTSGSAALPDRT